MPRHVPTYRGRVPDLDLPRSVVLALWLGAGRSPATTAAALRGVQVDDEPHDVLDTETGERRALAEALEDWSARDIDVVALLPTPGDAAGVPAAVSTAALAAHEVVLVHTGAGARALVPEVSAFGSPLEPGHLVTWHLSTVPDWLLPVQALGSLEDADRGLRRGLADVTDALVRLDVAHWDARARGPGGRRCAMPHSRRGGCPTASTRTARACSRARPGSARSSTSRRATTAARSTSGRPTSARPRCATWTGSRGGPWSRRPSPVRALSRARRGRRAASAAPRRAHEKWSSTRRRAASPHRAARSGVGHGVDERRGQVRDEPLGVARRARPVLHLVDRHEPAGHAVVDDLGDAARRGADDGQPDRHGLEVDDAERLVHRRADEHRRRSRAPRRGPARGSICSIQTTPERCVAQLLDQARDLGSDLRGVGRPRAQHELDVGGQRLGGPQQVRQALLARDPADEDDRGPRRVDPQRAYDRARPRRAILVAPDGASPSRSMPLCTTCTRAGSTAG